MKMKMLDAYGKETKTSRKSSTQQKFRVLHQEFLGIQMSRRLSMRTPSSQEEVMNKHVTTETEQPALKEVTNLTSQKDTSSANGSTSARTSGIQTTAETQRLVLVEANLRLDQFGTNISTLEKRLSSLESSQSLQLTPSSSSSSSAEDSVKKRRKVPSIVSVWCYE